MKTKNCKDCEGVVSSSATLCPHCGVRYPNSKYSQVIEIVLFIIICAFIAWVVT